MLVRIRAAGINPIDYKLRSDGLIGGEPPAVLGWDASGVIEAIGPDVTRFQAGDEVYFCDGGFGTTPGTYQELKVLDERLVAVKPAGISFFEAAAAPLVTITAWEAQSRSQAHTCCGTPILSAACKNRFGAGLPLVTSCPPRIPS